MRRRDFLKALAGGTVAALVGAQPEQVRGPTIPKYKLTVERMRFFKPATEVDIAGAMRTINIRSDQDEPNNIVQSIKDRVRATEKEMHRQMYRQLMLGGRWPQR